MSVRIPIVLLLLASLGGCADYPAQTQGGEAEAFCGPAMERVESFMGSFEGLPHEGDRYGGTAVSATVAELDRGMNGFAPIETGASQHQMFVNLMTLIQYDESLEPVPYLAESWEVSPDLMEITFHLRDDVYWHDGELTTARDVAFTYLRASDPTTGYPNLGFFHYYLPGGEGVEVLDDFTLRFHLARPHAEYLDPWRTVAIMPEHLLGDVPPADLVRHPFGTVCPVGNGPFRFVTHLPDERWVFEANPWFPEGLGGRPYLDRYVFRTIPENATLLAELLTGGIDVYVSVTPNTAERIRGEDELEVRSYPSRSVFFAGWNARVPKLADSRVRRALTVGTNRAQILEGIRFGRGSVANTGVPQTHWAYDPALADSLPYDPDQARRLLAEAGWEDRDGDGVRENGEGEPLVVEVIVNPNQERQEVGEIMQAQLREVGVDLQLRVIEMGVLVDRITSPERDFEGFLLSWESEFRLDERDQFHSEAVDRDYAFSGIQDQELDRYLDTLQLIPARGEAEAVWRAYQNRLVHLQPYTFLYYSDRQNGVNRRLQGVVMDVRGDWQNVREWWIDPQEGGVP
jgi:peptide/nickel transport system substrate-binding protein